MKFNHIGIPTKDSFDGEIRLPHLRITCSDHQSNPYGVQWMNYWDDAPYPELVKTVAHVAFINVQGAPVELMQIDHARRPDL